MSPVARPSELELQVLAVLWREGALTAREVSACMPDGKARAYTTVLSVLQVMEKKGLVKHRPDGRAAAHQELVDALTSRAAPRSAARRS